MGHVVLLNARGRKWLVPTEEGLRKVKGVGRVQTTGLHRLVGKRLTVDGRDYLVLEPSVRDLLETMPRKAQIVGPKDAAYILFTCGLKSGDLVVEGGAGSGYLTVALAHAVSPNGRVVSYEVREDFRQVAQGNVERSGLADVVTFRGENLHEGIRETGARAVVLDLPDPWRAIPTATAALLPTGTLASFSPTVEQARETVLALREGGFADVWTVELLERRLEVKQGTRPAFDMLGHTGYLSFGRAAEESL